MLERIYDETDPVFLQGYADHLAEPAARMTAAGEENVLFALENLHTYPVVAAKLAAGKLRLHGWFFKIATGDLFAYDATMEQFQPIQKPV